MKEIEKVDNNLYKEEFAILNYLYERLDFSVFSREVYCKSNFYETIAWYIELLKEKNGSFGWKETMQKLIDDILKYEDDAERFKFLYYYFVPMKIEWYENHGWKVNAASLKLSLYSSPAIIDSRYTRDDEGKIDGIFVGIVKPAIPQWYWIWFDGHELEKEVITKNRQNFINALRHGYNKANNKEEDNI